MTDALVPCSLGDLLLYFLRLGTTGFGGPIALVGYMQRDLVEKRRVPFLYGGVVGSFHWLTERQFLDAVAVAMITPGPVVITVAFIGYLVAGALGGTLAALGVFLPCYLFVVIPAAYFRRSVNDPRVKAFVDGVTAAATGAIAGAAIVLGRRSLVDAATIMIGLVTFLVLTYVKKIPEPLVILTAGLIGLGLKGIVAP